MCVWTPFRVWKAPKTASTWIYQLAAWVILGVSLLPFECTYSTPTQTLLTTAPHNTNRQELSKNNKDKDICEYSHNDAGTFRTWWNTRSQSGPLWKGFGGQSCHGCSMGHHLLSCRWVQLWKLMEGIRVGSGVALKVSHTVHVLLFCPHLFCPLLHSVNQLQDLIKSLVGFSTQKQFWAWFVQKNPKSRFCSIFYYIVRQKR